MFSIRNYLSDQPEVTSTMRAVLVDWLAEVQESFELNHETLYLGVKLIDHFLSKQRVSKRHLQLVGASAILIAGKFDVRVPIIVLHRYCVHVLLCSHHRSATLPR